MATKESFEFYWGQIDKQFDWETCRALMVLLGHEWFFDPLESRTPQIGEMRTTVRDLCKELYDHEKTREAGGTVEVSSGGFIAKFFNEEDVKFTMEIYYSPFYAIV